MRNYINVIASEAKQSILPLRREMDCFASLAMTAPELWQPLRTESSAKYERATRSAVIAREGGRTSIPRR
jgi:hypothetical protein